MESYSLGVWRHFLIIVRILVIKELEFERLNKKTEAVVRYAIHVVYVSLEPLY